MIQSFGVSVKKRWLSQAKAILSAQKGNSPRVSYYFKLSISLSSLIEIIVGVVRLHQVKRAQNMGCFENSDGREPGKDHSCIYSEVDLVSSEFREQGHKEP